MKTVFSFGEILFDVYPEKSVIGGAPFNFSAHMANLGNKVSFITAIGKDNLGTEAIKYINQFNINADYVNITDKSTGICKVTLSSDNSPAYELITNVAYDNIELTEQQKRNISLTEDKYLYFGTLAQRQNVSANTLKNIIENNTFNDVFYDINIRQNFYSYEIIDYCLNHTTVLKISREETEILRTVLDIQSCSDEELCNILAERYKTVKIILLTKDKDGASLYDSELNNFIYQDAIRTDVVSTVGAGDSFFAAFANGYIKGKPIKECLNSAVILSSYVISRLDAVPLYSEKLRTSLNIQ